MDPIIGRLIAAPANDRPVVLNADENDSPGGVAERDESLLERFLTNTGLPLDLVLPFNQLGELGGGVGGLEIHDRHYAIVMTRLHRRSEAESK